MSPDRPPLIQVTLMALSLLLPSLLPGVAGSQSLIDPRQRSERQAPAISLDQAVQMAERQYNAKAVRAEQVTSGNRVFYQIRLLNAESKVWTVRVDASTGQMY